MKLISKFEVLGLHGYKNLSISFYEKSTVVMAENGAGKTTLLNCLYYFLTKNFDKLYFIPFEKLKLHFTDGVKLEFEKRQAYEFNLERNRFILNKLRIDINNNNDILLLNELLNLYISNEKYKIRHNILFRRIYKETPYDEDDILNLLNKIILSMQNERYIADIKGTISKYLDNLHIVYLPTYRRIEASSFEIFGISEDRRVRFRNDNNLEQIESENSEKLINFGLFDVENQINKLTESIKKDLLISYNKVSSNIINYLAGLNSSDGAHIKLDKDNITLIMKRLGRYQDSDIDTVVNEIINNENSNSPLNYLFQQLINSYQESKRQEDAIEKFTEVINSYFDISRNNEKKMSFNKLKLDVTVKNTKLEDNVIPLSALSSGEKQIISIFAKLILNYQSKYLILIDEPELSLSIEWQRKFLPDIANTMSCHQLLAITHSPFIFENELDSYATDMEVLMKDSLE
ncbi:AAA family ATPase [Neisseria sp.]